MKRNLGIVAIVVVLLVITGCTTFQTEGLSFSMDASNEVYISSFEKKVTVHEFLGTSGGDNLFNVTSDAMNDEVIDVITREILKAGGNGARNISIKYSASFLDLFLNWITGTIYAPATLEISGDVIKTLSVTAQEEMEEEIDLALASL